MATNTKLPPPPPGFTLVESSSIPPPPPGFVPVDEEEEKKRRAKLAAVPPSTPGQVFRSDVPGAEKTGLPGVPIPRVPRPLTGDPADFTGKATKALSTVGAAGAPIGFGGDVPVYDYSFPADARVKAGKGAVDAVKKMAAEPEPLLPLGELVEAYMPTTIPEIGRAHV